MPHLSQTADGYTQEIRYHRGKQAYTPTHTLLRGSEGGARRKKS